MERKFRDTQSENLQREAADKNEQGSMKKCARKAISGIGDDASLSKGEKVSARRKKGVQGCMRNKHTVHASGLQPFTIAARFSNLRHRRPLTSAQ